MIVSIIGAGSLLFNRPLFNRSSRFAAKASARGAADREIPLEHGNVEASAEFRFEAPAFGKPATFLNWIGSSKAVPAVTERCVR
jgi:hypothetical protein